MKTGKLEWNKLKANQINVYSSHSICIKNYMYYFSHQENMDLLLGILLVLQKYWSTANFYLMTKSFSL